MLAGFAIRSRNLIVAQAQRDFARVPSICFLGPRSKTNKSVGAYASAPGHISAEAQEERSSKKALSLNCELEFADVAADRWARLPFSDREIDCINQGTNDIEQDWRQIRL